MTARAYWSETGPCRFSTEMLSSLQWALWVNEHDGGCRICDLSGYLRGRSRSSKDNEYFYHRITVVSGPGPKPSLRDVSRHGWAEFQRVFGNNGCYRSTGERSMSNYKLEPFKIAIGSPTNQERTFLAGEDGVFVGDSKALCVHALPIYRQKDYPVYQARKQGPYVVTLCNSGIRISATAQKMVFPNRDDAVKFAETVGGLFNLFGIPLLSEDPREVLEAAKEKKEQVYEPMKAMAESCGAVFIVPQKE